MLLKDFRLSERDADGIAFGCKRTPDKDSRQNVAILPVEPVANRPAAAGRRVDLLAEDF